MILNRKSFYIISVIFLLMEINPIHCFAKDSTIVFKVSVGANYTRYKTMQSLSQIQRSHFSGSQSVFAYKDTGSYSPTIIISVENKVSKNVSSCFDIIYNRSKLSYFKRSENDSYDPYTYSSYYEKENIGYKIVPNNFIIDLGIKVNIKNFYVTPKFNACFSFANTIINDTVMTENTQGLTKTSTTILKPSKESFFNSGVGVGLAIGYEFNSKPFPIFVEAQLGYSSTSFQKLKVISSSLTIGIKLRKAKK